MRRIVPQVPDIAIFLRTGKRTWRVSCVNSTGTAFLDVMVEAMSIKALVTS